ncbi:MAG TPA: ABC transporter permease [Bryobacteraceae bacterium]|nr:ABC transporter permease [Bryobacteraceae bacterium]
MTWWNRLLRRKHLEEQLEKELRFHLEQHTADLIARGYNPAEARRQARLAMGGSEQVKEECRDARGTRWLEDLWQDVRYALRTLRQRPGFAAVALLTLALGIGATTVMFTVINGVVLKPLPYPEPDRLLTVHGQNEKYGEQWGFSYLEFLDCQRQSRALGSMAAWTYGGGTVSEPGEAQYVDGREISSELFSVLSNPLLIGRAFLPQEDQPGGAPVVIISNSLWQRRYGGSPGAIGRPLIFDGKPYTVVGVAPAGFRLDGEADVFTPLGHSTRPQMQNRGARFIHVLGRLRTGVTPIEAQAELSLIARRLAQQYPQFNEGRGMVAHPLRQEVVGEIRPTLWLLLGAVSLVLLIACVNVANLQLARAVSRERELAMRVALGAGRGRLVRQCLTEGAVLGLSGGVIGVLLATAGIRPFVLFWPGSLPRAEDAQLDWYVLLFALVASLGSGLLFGLAPALRAPARELEQTLRAGARTLAGSSHRLHSGFVISEIALAVVLLVSAGILGRTLVRLSSLDPGINIHNVLTTRVALSPATLASAGQIRAAWQQILDRARRLPEVQSVALADIVPMREGEDSVGYWATTVPPPPNQEPIALASSVTPDYLKVMGIPLRHGRFFNEQDRMGHDLVVVIDDVLAQHAFGGSEAVGKRLWIPAMGPSPVQVIGVVGHVRHWGLAGDDQSRVRDQIYYSFAQVPDPLLRFFSSVMSMVVRTKIPPLSLIEPLRSELRGTAGDQVLYNVRTMEQLAKDSLVRQRFLLLLFGIFAGLALMLACIGIYGVLAYLTSQRVPEFGIRMALGATARDVMQLVMRESLGMIVLGVGVGIGGAWAAGRVLVRLVAGVQSAELVSFAVMIPVLVIAALLASFLPAHRASRVDPVKALRQE